MGFEDANKCGDHGYVTKDGRPCGYTIGVGEKACPHHREDKTFAKQFQMKGWVGQQQRMPSEDMPDHEFQTTQDIRATLASVIREVCKRKSVDLRRMDIVIKTCNAANAVLQTEAIKELNETVLRAEGHGPALVILESLKAGRTRKLSERAGAVARKVVEEEEELGKAEAG
jgi:hypothetical protein